MNIFCVDEILFSIFDKLSFYQCIKLRLINNFSKNIIESDMLNNKYLGLFEHTNLIYDNCENMFNKYLINCRINNMIQTTKIVNCDTSDLINFEDLCLGRNRLCIFPPELSLLKKLKNLKLHANEISIIPPEISSLINLEILDFRCNNISVIPQEISSLINLEFLDFGSNKIKIIPPEISRLIIIQIQ
jgi:Leucine-rich repeat (LRR) protein